MTIRRQPEDFRVEEILDADTLALASPTPEASRLFALYRLSKTSMTTPEAAGRLAKALGVRVGAVEYAGLKDKHAQTSQHVTVKAADVAIALRLVPSVEGQGFSAERLGFVGAPITADAIDRNRFAIVVRDLSKQASAEMDRRAALLFDRALPGAESRTLLVVNYFGDQRFGSARHKQGFVARRLIEGDFLGALRLAVGTPARKDAGKSRRFTRLCAQHWGQWPVLAEQLPRCPERAPFERLASAARSADGVTERDAREAFALLPYFLQQMYVEAYQSHLWNDTARRLVRSIEGECEGRPIVGTGGGATTGGLIQSTDTFGDLVFLPASTARPELRNLRLPMLGPKTQLAEPWLSAAAAALLDEGIAVEQLRIPGLRRPYFGETARPLFVPAERFTMDEPEPDELSSARRRTKRLVAFDLPRGSYATVVLRALGQ